MTHPELTALLDQADAASRDATEVLAAMADAGAGQLCQTRQAGPAAEIVTQFAAKAAAGRLTFCPHLPTHGPAPAQWVPYRPGRLRCAACLAAAARSMRGTREDATCDRCRRYRPGSIYPSSLLLPPVVVDAPGFLAATGPVTVHYGLCGACHAEQLTHRYEQAAGAS